MTRTPELQTISGLPRPCVRVGVIVLLTVSSAIAAAQTAANQPFDVKTGLWELSYHITFATPTTDIKPDLPAGLTAQQRAQYLAALAEAQKKIAASQARGGDTKARRCITPAYLSTGNITGELTDCAGQQLHSSANKVSVLCPRFPPSPGPEMSWQFQRIDAEHFTGSMHQVNDDGKRTDETIVGRWLDTSCAAAPAAKPAPAAAATAPATASSAPAASQPGAGAPVVGQLRRTGNQYFAFVANHGQSPLTGYMTIVAHYGSAGAVNCHFYDLRMLNYPPIAAGAVHTEELPGIVTDVKMVAGVFADGSSYGPQKDVADLMERRNVKLNTFRTIVASLCEMQGKGASAQAAVSSLEAARASAPKSGTSMDISIQDGSYVEATHLLQQQMVRNAGSAIPATVDKLREWASGLMADPVRDPGGELYIKANASQFTCGR